MAQTNLTDARQGPRTVDHARACLEETARRGSTAKERATAIAWLQQNAHYAEMPIGQHPHRAPTGRSLTGQYLKRAAKAVPPAPPPARPAKPIRPANGAFGLALD